MDKSYKKQLSLWQKSLLSMITETSSQKLLDFKFCGPLNFEQSIEIYKNNYRQNLINNLKESFEACHKLLGEDIFHEQAILFIKKNPYNEDIISYGQTFPEFLPTYDLYPFLYELACLERIIKEIFLTGKKKTMKITHPVHQIWTNLLYKKEEINPLEKTRILSIERKGELIFFSS